MQDVVAGDCDSGCVVAPVDCSSVDGEDGVDLSAPVHLQLAVVCDSLHFHEVLDLGAQVPAVGGNLVAAEVDVGRAREDAVDLADHVLGKNIGLLFGEVELAVVASTSIAFY